MRNNTRLIQAAKAHRKTGFHFDQLQFAGIHCNVDGSLSKFQNGTGLAGGVAVGWSPLLKVFGCFSLSAEVVFDESG